MKNKTITQSLLLGILTLVQIHTFAQNSGPNTPDFSRFEPVDATDMVNLLTGDFVYTLPILNIPNRGYGSHPLALSYNAGIMPDQEASWVGLGWTLNPGSIKTSINGAPDDHIENKKTFVSTFSGERTYYSIGVGVKIKKVASASIGYTWGSEGYNSFNVGLGATLANLSNEKYELELPSSLGLTAGELSLNLSNKGVSYGVNLVSASLGQQGNKHLKISPSMDVGYSNDKFSITGGVGISATAMSIHKDRNYSSTTSVSSRGVKIKIPIKKMYISISKTKQRIKQFATSYQTTYGNLYPSYNNFLDSEPYLDAQLDILKIPYNEHGYYSEWFNRENNTLTYPAKDSYAVFGQGISGSFAVEHNNPGLLYGTKEVHHEYDGNETDISSYYHQGGFQYRLIPKRYEFHFNNENSYKVSKTPNNDFSSYSSSYLTSNIMENITYSYGSGQSNYRDNEGDLFTSSDISTIAGQTIPKLGKQNIEWFTNDEIAFNIQVNGKTPKERGFIEASCLSTAHRKAIFNYNEGEAYYLDQAKRNQAKSIGAYSVTTPDGLTYNYSLPVYNYETINLSSHTSSNGDESQQIHLEQDKYVTNWLLTSIVGPDYIDVNNNGLDEADYGYWVEFNYGQFTNGYQWKFPYTSADENTYNWEMQGDMNNKTLGRKDIYYLNSIKTKSHTAFFIKDSRTDGLGSDYKINEDFGNSIKGNIVMQSFNNQSHKVLRLSKIILLENKDAYLISNIGGSLPGYIVNEETTATYPGQQYDYKYLYTTITTSNYNNASEPQYYQAGAIETYKSSISVYQMDNVLDQDDISTNYNTISDRALQIIEFNQDYSLGQNCDNCSNGKLTLNSIDIKARGGHSILPPYQFLYNEGAVTEETLSSQYLNLEDPSSNVKLDKDVWGYYTGNQTNNIPDEGSLKEIKTPTGSVIAINYEEDDYQGEYALINEIEYPIYALYADVDHSTLSGFDVISTTPQDYYLELSKPLSTAFNVGNEIDILMQIETLKAKKGLKHIGSTTDAGPHLFNNVSCSSNTGFCNGVSIDKTVHAEILELSANRRFLKVKLNDSVSIRKDILEVCTSLKDGHVVAIKDIYKFWNVKIREHESSGNVKGGGLRVRDIRLKNNGSTVSRIHYDYNNSSDPHNPHLSSGYTSYTPTTLEYVPYQELMPTPNVMYKTVTSAVYGKNGTKELTTEFHHNIPTMAIDGYNEGYSIPDYFEVDNITNFRYIPSQQTADPDGFYYFDQDWQATTTANSNHYKALSYRNTVIHRMFSNLGSLNKVITRNNLNQENSSKVYSYHTKEKNIDDKVGMHQETYLTKRKRTLYNPSNNHLRKSQLFSVQTSVVDYQILRNDEVSVTNGLTNTTIFKDYDVLSGAPMSIVSENSFGDRFRTKNIPAHQVYSEMGPKTDDVSNKNMLIQNAASYLFLDNNDNNYTNDKVINASVTTWKKDWKYREFKNGEYQTTNQYPNSSDIHTNVWRKNTTYSWRSKLEPETGAYLKANGTGLFNTDDEFNFDNESSYANNANGWIKNSEVSLYNHSSEPIEVKDVNNQYISSKQWKGLTVSRIIGASYSGYCSSTAEEKIDGEGYSTGDNPRYFETETKLGNNTLLTQTNSHTGKHSLFVTNGGDEAFVSNFKLKAVDGDEITPQDYFTLSVWVKGNIGTDANNVAVKVHPPELSSPIIISNPDIITTGDWKQLRYTFKMTNAVAYIFPVTYKVSVGSSDNYEGNLYFDDYRLHPVGASMTNYVYDDQNRIVYILNENNLGTKYEYNDRGQLWKVYTEKVGPDGGFKLTSESEMHYGEE